MKLIIDEKLKHRLVGLAVVLSLAVFFLPSMMKKSSLRLEHKFSVNVQLPPKPIAPKVVMTDKKVMFKTIKVAKVDISPGLDKKSAALDKEDFIQSVQVSHSTITSVAKNTTPKSEVASQSIELALNNAAKEVVTKQINTTKSIKPIKAVKVQELTANAVGVAKIDESNPANKTNIYAVQLASFAQLANAEALVDKLQSQGYKANYIKTTGKRGVIYKVYVGHSSVKSDVIKVKTQLASAMRLNGFVVNTGVS